jgi:predicted nucleotidyltransferase
MNGCNEVNDLAHEGLISSVARIRHAWFWAGSLRFPIWRRLSGQRGLPYQNLPKMSNTMQKQEILQFLQEHKEEITKRFQAKIIGLFGSVARGETTPESDIDLLIEIPPKIELMFALEAFLEKNLHQKVDIVRKHPHLKKKFIEIIQKDMIYV